MKKSGAIQLNLTPGDIAGEDTGEDSHEYRGAQADNNLRRFPEIKLDTVVKPVVATGLIPWIKFGGPVYPYFVVNGSVLILPPAKVKPPKKIVKDRKPIQKHAARTAASAFSISCKGSRPTSSSTAGVP
ncbi:hypothetical protein B0H13DRAFT_1866898 [Mycena leptocephala]|nr:hypothetical protein B0H13DRAFT_1866898 [Mycena leptocephala]